MNTSRPAAFALERLQAGNLLLAPDDVATLESLLKKALLEDVPRCVAELVALSAWVKQQLNADDAAQKLLRVAEGAVPRLAQVQSNQAHQAMLGAQAGIARMLGQAAVQLQPRQAPAAGQISAGPMARFAHVPSKK